MSAVMVMGELVSVIVPTYNFGSYIGGCIESILNQTYANIEVIVVNDGSTDESKGIIDSYASKDSRIRAIHKLNEGVSVARNFGLDAAKGDYVVFVDGDDYLSADHVEYMLNLVKKNDAQFGLSLNCFTKQNEPQAAETEEMAVSPNAAVALLLSPRVTVGCWNKIYSKKFLDNNSLRFSTDLFYGEGLHFITRVAQKSNCVAIGNHKVYYYRRNNYASATSKFSVEKLRNGERAIEMIEKEVDVKDTRVRNMLEWHRTQFKMGIIIRLIESGNKKAFQEYYHDSYKYMIKSVGKNVFKWDISLYKRMLLIGTCISPKLMASLDKTRRKHIANNSFSN